MKMKIYDKIIYSAEQLFNRFGISKTAVSDIASAAEVSRATIFNNFGSKDGVLKAVLYHREKELRNDINRCVKKENSVSGKIKVVLLGRINLLSSLRFITDKAIASYANHEIDSFMDNLNYLFRKSITMLLHDGRRSITEVESLVNTIFFLVKGIEQGLPDQLDRLYLGKIEKDIDYFLKLAISEHGRRTS